MISHVGSDPRNRLKESKDSFGVDMTNYGEVLTYWYLRLNGFVPITNYVLHGDYQSDNMKYSSDCDLLAVRFPYACEEIGKKELDLDQDLFEKLGPTENLPIGLIVQVKTGEYTQNDLKKSFSKDNLEYAIKRIGFAEKDKASDLAAGLMNCAKLIEDDFILAKLAVLGETSSKQNSFIIKNIPEIDKFIRNRIKKHENTKRADRMFFPDPLIQYLAGMGGDTNG